MFKRVDYSSIIDVAIMGKPVAPYEWETFKKEDYSSIIDVAIMGEPVATYE